MTMPDFFGYLFRKNSGKTRQNRSEKQQLRSDVINHNSTTYDGWMPKLVSMGLGPFAHQIHMVPRNIYRKYLMSVPLLRIKINEDTP